MKSKRTLTVVASLALGALFACSHAGRDLSHTLYKVNGDLPKAAKMKKGRSIAQTSDSVDVHIKFNLYNGNYAPSNKPVTVSKGIDELPVRVTINLEDYVACSMNDGSEGNISSCTVQRPDGTSEVQDRCTAEFIVDKSEQYIQCENKSPSKEKHVLGVTYTFQKKSFDFSILKDSKYAELSAALRAFANKTLSSDSPEADKQAYYDAIDLFKKEGFAQKHTLLVQPGMNGGFLVQVDGKDDRLTYASGFQFRDYDAVTFDEFSGELYVGNGKKQLAKYKVPYTGLPKNLVKGKFPFKGEDAYALVCKELRTDKSFGGTDDKWPTILGAARTPYRVHRGKAYSNVRCYVNAPEAEVRKKNVWGSYIVKISHLPYKETLTLVEGTLKGEEEQLAKASRQANNELIQKIDELRLGLLAENASLDSLHAQAVAAKKATDAQIQAAVEQTKKELEEQYGSVLAEQTAKADEAKEKAEKAEKQLDELTEKKAEAVVMTREEETKLLNEKYNRTFQETITENFYPAYIHFVVQTKVKTEPKSEWDEISAPEKKRVHLMLTNISPKYCSTAFMVPGKEGEEPLFWEGPYKYQPNLLKGFLDLKTGTEFEKMRNVKAQYIMSYGNLPYLKEALSKLQEQSKSRKKPITVEQYIEVIEKLAPEIKNGKLPYQLLCDDHIKKHAQNNLKSEIQKFTFSRDISSTTFVYKRSYWELFNEYEGKPVQKELLVPDRIEMTYVPNVSGATGASFKNLSVTRTLYKHRDSSDHPFFACGDVKQKKNYEPPKNIDDNYNLKTRTGTIFPAFNDDGEVVKSEPVLPKVDEKGTFVCPVEKK